MENVSLNDILDIETTDVISVSDNDLSGNDIESDLLDSYPLMISESFNYTELLTSIDNKLTIGNNLLTCMTFFIISVWLWKKAKAICINCFGGDKYYD